ncbi:transporter substrate-binding domain-containing protein [Thalassotalea sp. G2M2-11]|uniref:substrate-binding periplasmic protein n=1 Tax=Thalassotalea sp. G2M2-11 TaxID=2787627 RepID=UPI0019D24BEC|nr:transporter substrate-binding domain-containing protein [Thalassotalea sp. G2M2-11]
MLISVQLHTCQAIQIDKTEISWATEEWPNYTDRDGSGFYHELFNTIFAKSPYTLTVQYVPWKRAINHVSENKAHLTGALPKGKNYNYAEQPVLTQPISILIKHDASINSLVQLSTQLGTWPERYKTELFQPEIAPYIKGVGSQQRKGALNLLINDKVQYYLDIRSMIEAQLTNLSAEQRKNYRIIDLSSLNLYFIFSEDKQGQAVKRFYDHAFQQLLSEGVLQEIYNKYQIAIPDIN